MSRTELSVEAKHDKRMIEVKVRFWVHDIAKGKNKILPKECWDSGVVRITPNESHAIKTGSSFHFNSLMQLNAMIEKILTNNKIKLHHSKRSAKYYR